MGEGGGSIDSQESIHTYNSVRITTYVGGVIMTHATPIPKYLQWRRGPGGGGARLITAVPWLFSVQNYKMAKAIWANPKHMHELNYVYSQSRSTTHELILCKNSLSIALSQHCHKIAIS